MNRYDSFNSGELKDVFEWLEAQGDDVKVLSFTKDTFDFMVIIDRGVQKRDEDESGNDKPHRGRPKGSKNKPKDDDEA